MKSSNSRIKFACYTTSLTMSVVGNLSPILFITFRTLYGISYSLLGLLVVINFLTQLTVDLIFSFYSHRFNISKTVRSTPLLAAIGLLIYAVWPFLFPSQVYIGLVAGTVIFSAAAGLGEVLISPVIAAIPAKDPDREMSKLHSVYAWGVVGVIIIGTLFLFVFKSHSWQGLVLLFILIPLASAIAFSKADIPQMETPQKISGVMDFLKKKELWLCILAIFLGGAAECTMAQWSSSYIEQALNIPKVWGDIFGVAMFGLTLGLGRTLYSKFGKNIEKILLLCFIGATVCYLTAALAQNPLIGLIACALTGLCTSMLWPGNLIIAANKFPHGGVFLYAIMAAGGDLGASVAPQLVGLITDAAINNGLLLSIAEKYGITTEQFGMKLGMLGGMLFPLMGIPLFVYMYRTRRR